MSEHQYYEFRAVDRPLSLIEQGELRRLSSRARISAAGFANDRGEGWLDKLAALGGDLINGDLRLFCLLWPMPYPCPDVGKAGKLFDNRRG